MSFLTYAQDIIVYTNGETIKSKVTEILTDNIKYLSQFKIKYIDMNCSKTLVLLFLGLFLWQTTSSQEILDEIFQNPPQAFIQLNMRDQTNPKARALGPGFFEHNRPYMEIYSPSTSQFAGTRDGNLYIRNENSDDVKIIATAKEGWYWHIDNAMWSPDGKFIAAKQINDEGVNTIKLSHDSPDDISEKTYFRAGKTIPKYQFYVVDTNTSELVEVQQNSDFPYVHLMDWNPDNQSLFIVQSNRLMKRLQLVEANAKTGQTSILLTETSDTYLIGLELLQGYSQRLIDMGLFSFLKDRDQFVWMSERTGFKQLYLYNTDGTLIRSLTTYNENGILEYITEIDEQNGWIYFMSHSDIKNPYENQIFRTSLESQNIEKLVSKENVFDAFMSQDNDSLYVVRSGLPVLMELEVYTPDGTYLSTPWKGNTEKIEKGYLNIEYVDVLAADDKTEISTMIIKPRDFDPDKAYPVVEYIYGGNFATVVRRDLPSFPWIMVNLANEGFVVVFIDGRGTPQRGKEFQDFSYGKFGQVELQDHVYALKQLARERPYMNMEKIGITGTSWGGHFALRALLEYPDFYKAGHINAAAIDPLDFRVAIELFMGCLPADCPDAYKKSNITDKLGNLKAPLMIVHGTADDDVPIDDAYGLIKKLDSMDYKNYEFIKLQGHGHFVMRHPEWETYLINFFVKTLK